MQRTMRLQHTLAAWLLAFLAPVALASPIETRHLQSLGETSYHKFESRGLQRAFHIFVDLPENYAESDESYPVIYLLDGGNTFPMAASMHHFLRFGDETPRAILVGISYGADTYREGNLRQTDFTAPAAALSFWGGAGRFQQMLTSELLPFIETTYRTDPQRRILFGHSLGAQFVLYSALTHPESFYGHIASSPALQLNREYFFKWRGDGTAPPQASRLFLSLGEQETGEAAAAVHDWIRHWRAREVRPWSLETRILPGQTHYSTVPEAFRQGLEWLLRAQ